MKEIKMEKKDQEKWEELDLQMQMDAVASDLSKKEGCESRYKILADKYGYELKDTGCSYFFEEEGYKEGDSFLQANVEVPYLLAKDTGITIFLICDVSEINTPEGAVESLSTLIQKKDSLLEQGYSGKLSEAMSKFAYEYELSIANESDLERILEDFSFKSI